MLKNYVDKVLIGIFAVIGSMTLTPFYTLARDGVGTGKPKAPDVFLQPIVTGVATDMIVKAVYAIADWLLLLAGGLAIAYLIWGGIQYITGGSKGAENAKGIIINAIIGIMIILLAYVIINTVKNFLAVT